MSDTKNAYSNNITNKIRSSLVIKLNVRMIGRLFSGFLTINFLIILLSLFVVFWKVEEGAQDIIDMLELSPNNIELIHSNKYQVVINEKSSHGIIFLRSIQKKLPIDILDVRRNITVSEIDKNMGLMKKVDLIKYTMSFSINDSSYQIIYDLGSDLKLLITLFFIVFICEFLIIIKNIGKGSRMIKQTLKPLSDLTETAKSLNAEVASMNSKTNGRHIKDFAGVISSIDAHKLDRRISIDSSQNELKDLASAINDMLNRINDSYQSQVRFVSDASHELRTPISVIQGYVNLLDRWGKNDEQTMQESIDAIKSETENMKELVEQLLFLARSDNETIQLYKKVFDSCEVIDEILHETQMIDSNHHFETDLKRPAYVNADRQLLKQAIRIFVDNSIKFTPSGGKIILRIINKEGYVYITVQDSGIGISPEDLPNIFNRFYRSDESRARKTGGSGLGLSIAKWIIEHHGAHFEVLSRVDIGTRITIIFPAVEMLYKESK